MIDERGILLLKTLWFFRGLSVGVVIADIIIYCKG